MQLGFVAFVQICCTNFSISRFTLAFQQKSSKQESHIFKPFIMEIINFKKYVSTRSGELINCSYREMNLKSFRTSSAPHSVLAGESCSDRLGKLGDAFSVELNAPKSLGIFLYHSCWTYVGRGACTVSDFCTDAWLVHQAPINRTANCYFCMSRHTYSGHFSRQLPVNNENS